MIEILTDNSEDRIFDFLCRCEKYFVPKLSEKVDVCQYAKKLSRNAENIFISIISDGTCFDVGHAAVYINDTEYNRAFISSFCIDMIEQGSGLAFTLMERVEDKVRSSGMYSLCLEVSEVNKRAVRFYEKYGFTVSLRREA